MKHHNPNTVMVSMPAMSVVDHGLESRSNQRLLVFTASLHAT